MGSSFIHLGGQPVRPPGPGVRMENRWGVGGEGEEGRVETSPGPVGPDDVPAEEPSSLGRTNGRVCWCGPGGPPRSTRLQRPGSEPRSSGLQRSIGDATLAYDVTTTRNIFENTAAIMTARARARAV